MINRTSCIVSPLEERSDFVVYNIDSEFSKQIYRTTANPNNTQLLLDNNKKIFEEDFRTHLAGYLEDERVLGNPQAKDIITKELIPHVSNVTKKEVVDLVYSDGSTLVDIWINFMKPTDHNPLHYHTGIYSFVWYLDVPEEIRQEHLSQVGTIPSTGLIQFLSNTGGDLLMNPKTNDMLIFDAKHRHQVYPFYSDNTRITVAGNIHGIVYADGTFEESKERFNSQFGSINTHF